MNRIHITKPGLLTILWVIISLLSYSQTSVTLYPDQDAYIRSVTPSVNYEEDTLFTSLRDTSGVVQDTGRSLIQFDLDTIPSQAKIMYASLTLYGVSHSSTATSNASYLYRVTSSWDESTVTWNSKPTTTATGSISLSASTAATQNYEIDVKDMIQSWVDGTTGNYGLLLRLQAEQAYAWLKFASGDYTTDTTKHPKLKIVYVIPATVTLYPDKDALIDGTYIEELSQDKRNTNYGTSNYVECDNLYYSLPPLVTDTFIVRSLIEFDLSSIPSDVTIDEAVLSLNANTSNGHLGASSGHYSGASTNESYLYRITSSWNESTVTWNNQPTTTATEKITLPESDSVNQNYEIDVSNFVQKWVDSTYDNYGLLLRLKTELNQDTNYLHFYSSDYTTDTTKHPRLEISYFTTTNYYVNDSSTVADEICTAVGNDENHGLSPAFPKRTISSVLEDYDLEAGDTIFVDTGEYPESIEITSSDGGSSSGYVVIQGVDKYKSILDTTTTGHNLYFNDVDYVKVSDMGIRNADSTYNVYIHKSKYNIIEDCKLTNDSLYNIYIKGESTPNQSYNNQIKDNIITTTAYDGICIYVFGACDTTEIAGNEITTDNTGDSYAIGFKYDSAGGVSLEPQNILIYDNIINAYAAGIWIYGESGYYIENPKIYNNTITISSGPSAGFGINMRYTGASSSYKTEIYNNKITNANNGIYLHKCGYAKVYNNYINCFAGMYIMNNNGRYVDAYNNSFNCSYSCIHFGSSTYLPYWNVKNNLFYNTSSTSSHACIVVKYNYGEKFSGCDNNIFYMTNAAKVAKYGYPSGTLYNTLADFQALDHVTDAGLYGDENSLDDNPLYLDIDNDIFDLETSSPAYKTGLYVSDVATDYYGDSRPDTLPTIGAVEVVRYVAVNTIGLDTTINGTDTLKYVISGAGLSDTIQAGYQTYFLPTLPSYGDTSTIYLSFFGDTSHVDTAKIYFKLDSLGKIHHVMYSNADTTMALDASFYEIVNDNMLVLLDGSSRYEEQQSLPIKVLLEDELVLSPNADDFYDEFIVEGVDDFDTYELTIRDVNGTTLFSTEDKHEYWDGYTTAYGSEEELVPEGTYVYEIAIDEGVTVRGQFLVEY